MKKVFEKFNCNFYLAFFAVIFSFLFVGIVAVKAQIPSGVDLAIEEARSPLIAAQTPEQAYNMCMSAPLAIEGLLGTGSVDASPIISCMTKQMKSNSADTLKVIGQFLAKQKLEEAFAKARQSLRDAWAATWKAGVKAITQKIAYDSASWIASGGKGQKPLFITEGWGAYLKDAADEASGLFLDDLNKRFGVDLCSPDFSVRILMQQSIDYSQPKVRCKFSKMAKNWQQAVQNPDYGFEYVSSFQPGENDISGLLMVRTGVEDAKAYNLFKKTVEGTTDSGFKAVTDWAGKILTPSALIKDLASAVSIPVPEKTDPQEFSFTGTIWDMVSTFVDTLASKLLTNLQDGYFKGSDSSDSNGFNFPFNLPSLNNPDSQPMYEGKAGAKNRLTNLVEGNFKTGSQYSVLNKLIQCSDEMRVNPGPTDCVIDAAFSQRIKERTMVKDLGNDFLNKPFSPSVNNVQNVQEGFTLRNILILRKYRIVPIGWEIAARYIEQQRNQTGNSANTGYTLGQVMSGFYNQNSPFYGLIDPTWVLKAPELYCKRLGFGGQDLAYNPNDNSPDKKDLNRAETCVDEQQCLKEDSSGNCKVYGYCTQEKRVWNFGGGTCEPRFNTCETYKTKAGATISYLNNTLDYRYCNAQNAGCRWYSQNWNPISNTWLNVSTDKKYSVCSSVNGCTKTVDNDTNWKVPYLGVKSANGLLSMASACTDKNGCSFIGKSCTIPEGGVNCRITNCLADDNIMIRYNGGFEAAGSGASLAQGWDLGYQNLNNLYARVSGQGIASTNALKVIATNNFSDIEAKSIKIENLIEGSKYRLNYSLKGSINEGGVSVEVWTGDSLLNGRTYSSVSSDYSAEASYFEFENQKNTDVYIKIITVAGTRGTVYLDNFELRRVEDNCLRNTVWLSNGLEASNNTLYINGNAEVCDGGSAGCSQFIRLKEGLGSNLMIFDPAGFSSTGQFSCTSSPDMTVTHSNSPSVKIGKDYTYTNNEWCTFSKTANYVELTAGKKYIFSGWYNTGYNTGLLEVSLGTATSEFTRLIIDPTYASTNGEWKQFYKEFTTITNYKGNISYSIIIQQGASTKVYSANFADFKLEEAAANQTAPTSYSVYNPSERPAEQVAYLKKAPDYYSCYKDGSNNWATSSTLLTILRNQKPACANYSGVCTKDEVGCESFTPLNQDPVVSGVVSSANLCPNECVGYQVYHQSETNFTKSKFVQFIADNKAKTCSANVAGCDEFTNLDEVGKGGETKEFYVAMKTCQKPNTVSEANYYTWEGSDTTGYQLKVFKLMKSELVDSAVTASDPAGATNAPCTYIKYAGSVTPVCADSGDKTGFCTVSESETNSDCRQFYDDPGSTHYRLLSRTITISDNCHPYRRTMTQKSLTETADDCALKQGYWNAQNECVYMAIPKEGTTCSAASAGCREYVGNQGNNVRNAIFSNFENGTGLDGWSGGLISSEANYPGGNSLKRYGGQLSHQVNILKGKAYVLSFWAKGDSNFTINSIRFAGAPNGTYDFANASVNDDSLNIAKVNITGDWKLYNVGPVNVDWGTTGVYATTTLDINIGGSSNVFYVDNIILKEVNKNVYVIANSWITPASCDNKLDDAMGLKSYPTTASLCNSTSTESRRCYPGEMLGCQAYKDRSGATINLRYFDKLCRIGAVGCEALIDTYNSNSPDSQEFSTGNNSTTTIPADKIVYLVNDQPSSCPASDKGCSALGAPSIDANDEVSSYSTIFLKNNPEKYSTDLCSFNELWCDRFEGERSTSYFKDPGLKTCEYKTIKNASTTGWYKAGTDLPCTTTPYQTLGWGVPSESAQPLGWINAFSGYEEADYKGWAGVCPKQFSGCTEYVDPSARIYNTILDNGDFSKLKSGLPVGWLNPVGSFTDPVNLSMSSGTLPVSLQTFTAYTLSAKITGLSTIKITCGSGVTIYSPDNSITKGAISGTSSPAVISGRFYLGTASTAISTAKCELKVMSGASVSYVKLAETGVYYQLSSKVDRTSCNSNVNMDDGCVLFNERNGVDYANSYFKNRVTKYLNFDADKTYPLDENIESVNTAPQIAEIDRQKNANSVIKVGGDRQCSSWLYCASYKKRDEGNSTVYGSTDKCMDFGLCSSVDDNGDCLRFTYGKAALGEAPPQYSLKDVNKTGYVSLGKSIGAVNPVVVSSSYPYQQMKQEGSQTNISNGTFSMSASNALEPLGWILVSSSDDKGWQDYKYRLGFETRKLKEGASYLQLSGPTTIQSEETDVAPNIKYKFSGWVNTLDLVTPASTANVAIQQLDGNGAVVLSTVMKTNKGLPWTFVNTEINSLPSAKKIRILLSNWLDVDNDNKCDDVDKNGKCDVDGSSLFDNIDIGMILNTDGTSAGIKERECRAYPESDSLGCKYYKDGKLYLGWSGYCLLRDPNNNQVCLQWWPMDEVEGEQLDEIGGSYNNRFPLYYCLNQKMDTIRVSRQVSSFENGQGQVSSKGLMDWIQRLVPGGGGGSKDVGVKTFKFEVPNNYNIFFRSPYVRSFNLTGLVGGVWGNGSIAVGVAFMFANMEPDTFTSGGAGVTFGGYKGVIILIPSGLFNFMDLSSFDGGEIMTLFNSSNDCDNLTESFNNLNCSVVLNDTSNDNYESCEVLQNTKNSSCSGTESNGIFQGIKDYISGLITGATSDAQSTFNGFSGLISNIKDVLQNSTALIKDNEANRWGGFSYACFSFTGGQLTACIPMNWQMGSVIINLARYASGLSLTGVSLEDMTVIGAKVITDEDQEYADQFSDPYPDIPGDILGVVWRQMSSGLGAIGFAGNISTNFNARYCADAVQVVTPTGKNKGWYSRVADNSSYTFERVKLTGDLEDPWEIENGIVSTTVPTVKVDFGTDYRPFGAIVAPVNSAQNPVYWDSRTEVDGFSTSRQPLFKEPTRISLGAPYQARMGSLAANGSANCGTPPCPKSDDLIKQLFAESYGRWIWQGSDSKNPSAGGSYVATSTRWTVPNTLCSGARTSSSYCYIKPTIGNIKVDNQISGVQIKSRKAVKLTFNVNIDKEQLPLKGYTVNWGDGSVSNVSGVDLRGRTDPAYPFSLYHFYDFSQVKDADNNMPLPGTTCSTSNCSVGISISAVDNWNVSSTVSNYNLNINAE